MRKKKAYGRTPQHSFTVEPERGGKKKTKKRVFRANSGGPLNWPLQGEDVW